MGGSPFNPTNDDASGDYDDGGVVKGSPPEDCPEAPATGHKWVGVTLWVEDRGSDVTEAYERCDYCGWYRIKTNPVVYEDT